MAASIYNNLQNLVFDDGGTTSISFNFPIPPNCPECGKLDIKIAMKNAQNRLDGYVCLNLHTLVASTQILPFGVAGQAQTYKGIYMDNLQSSKHKRKKGF